MKHPNFKIIADDDGLPDIMDTEEPHDNITVFDSFRACKNAILKIIQQKIEQNEKLINKLRLRKEDVHKLFKKDLDVVSDRNWRAS